MLKVNKIVIDFDFNFKTKGLLKLTQRHKASYKKS